MLSLCALLAVFLCYGTISVEAQWSWPYYGLYSWPYYGGYYAKRQAGFEPVQQPAAESIGGAALPLPRPPNRPFSDVGFDRQGQFVNRGAH
ncbi:hypothetical protein niasHS_011220 [Heterodera schachtii]|uniref:Secreted protein n=1 Tax=Heterodera schachtii TaxID=97005 RepID=A0ABD2J6J8_HETSC